MALPRAFPGEIALSRPDRITETDHLLAELASSPDPRALQDRLVRINMVVAREIARRYAGRGLAADDLEQVAYLGLVKAVQHYDGEKATEFLSYAVPTIRGELRRWFRDAGWVVRPPRSVQELQARVTRAQDELSVDLGHPPSTREIADSLEVDVDDVRRAMAANGCFSPTSLDAPSPSGQGDGDELVGRLGAADPGYAQAEARVALRPLLRDLDERERLLLEMRFIRGATQSEIGERLGVTQTQVSRLLSGVLERLRAELTGSASASAA